MVAGVVGEMLTAIFAAHSAKFTQAIANQESLAIAFGQALQMTNILKDSFDDNARGVSWIPQNLTTSALLDLALKKITAALAYILLIPKAEIGMRRFCLLALGLAVLTLNSLVEDDKKRVPPQRKISRRAVTIFYQFTKIAAHSNTLIRIFFFFAAQPIKRALIQR